MPDLDPLRVNLLQVGSRSSKIMADKAASLFISQFLGCSQAQNAISGKKFAEHFARQ